MRTLIFSDTHLTHRSDPSKFRFLQRIISDCDRVIINGDFWDYYHTSWEQFIDSPWKKLFPLLLSKKAIYLYGNHDYQKWNPAPQLFSTVQADFWTLKVGAKYWHIEHGNRITPSFNYYLPTLSRALAHYLPYQRLSFSRAPWNLHADDTIRKFAADHCRPDQILVCGHTHIANNALADRYLNEGFINFNKASYLLVDGDKFSLKDATY